jgi:hypothetical protein
MRRIAVMVSDITLLCDDNFNMCLSHQTLAGEQDEVV